MKTTSIQIISNEKFDDPSNRTFEIKLLRAMDGASLGSTKDAAVTIIEDDGKF